MTRIGDKSQALTAILKPVYAPIEQYGEAGSVKQGPWTDLYALGATLHFMLLGRPPPPATARAVQDDLQPLATAAFPGCSPAFLHTIDWMLAPKPADRPQSVAALPDVLEGRAAPPQRLALPAALPALSPAPRPAPSPAAPTPSARPAEPVLPASASAPPAPAPAVAADAAPARTMGPKESCSSRQLLAPWACIERQCRKAELRQHPDCVQMRIEQERRANPTQ